MHGSLASSGTGTFLNNASLWFLAITTANPSFKMGLTTKFALSTGKAMKAISMRPSRISCVFGSGIFRKRTRTSGNRVPKLLSLYCLNQRPQHKHVARIEHTGIATAALTDLCTLSGSNATSRWRCGRVPWGWGRNRRDAPLASNIAVVGLELIGANSATPPVGRAISGSVRVSLVAQTRRAVLSRQMYATPARTMSTVCVLHPAWMSMTLLRALYADKKPR